MSAAGKAGNPEPAPLSATGLAVGYPGRAVLTGLDLDLRAGELVCLLGPNGAGKSTLLRTLAGLQPPLAGRLRLAGRDTAGLPAAGWARHAAIVLTGRQDPGHLTVWDLAALGRYPHTGWSGRLSAADKEAVRRGLHEAGAWDLRARPCDELSDGERQRAMLARALAQDPAVLLLDEPTAFLDLPRRVEAMRVLRALARDRGRAVLLSTHDLDLALRAADRLWLAAGGTVRAGAPESLALAGDINAVFDQGDVVFDRSAGQFRIHGHPRRLARLAGEAEPAFWTARALEREGYACAEGAGVASGANVTNRTEGAEAVDGPEGAAGAAGTVDLDVRIERRGGAWIWCWTRGDGGASSGGLDDLIAALRR